MEKIERIKDIFLTYVNSNTDWSIAADMFVSWCVEKDFNNESFSNFVDWISDEELDDTWHFFFGYGAEFERFADDWVTDEERQDYISFAKKE